MKRLQIMIDEDLDQFLAVEALERGTSKAAIIRDYLRQAFGRELPPLEEDPITKMIGVDDVEPADIDEVVYGA